MSGQAKELFEASVDQVRRGDVRAALRLLLSALARDSRHEPSLRAAARICRVLGAAPDADLLEAVAAHPDDPSALFDLGYRLVAQERPDVATAVLRRGLLLAKGAEGETSLRRELAFAQHADKDFLGCLATLAPLAEGGDLAEAELLDVHLLQAESALYAGQRALCLRFLAAAEELVPEDDQRARLDALHALAGRAGRWPNLPGLGLREWHFIQHAGVILKTAGGPFEDGSRAGRFGVLELALDMVAFLLQRLLHLLERLGRCPETLLPAGETARPLAAALAARSGASLALELPADGERPTLLVAASAGELAPFAPALATAGRELSAFALCLDWTRPALVCPEIAGVLAQRALLPWENRYALDPASRHLRELPVPQGGAAHHADALLAAWDELPDDGGRARSEFEDFYFPLREDLALGNDEGHPQRRVFTPLSPCWPADGSGDERRPPPDEEDAP